MKKIKEKINDILVWLQLKKRVGVIVKADFEETSFIVGGGICMKSKVTKIIYEYKWKNPFKKVINAKKREVPFYKHSNPNCPQGK